MEMTRKRRKPNRSTPRYRHRVETDKGLPHRASLSEYETLVDRVESEFPV